MGQLQYELVIPTVLWNEGCRPGNPTGYANIPGDTGGETQWGISSQEWSRLGFKYPAFSVKVTDLTLEQAKQVYYEQYYLPAQCDKLPSASALVLLDAAVNEGVPAAVRILQSAVGTTPDGDVGPITLQAITNAVYAHPDLFNEILWQRVAAYDTISKENPTNQRFLAKLWIPRLLYTRQEAKKL